MRLEVVRLIANGKGETGTYIGEDASGMAKDNGRQENPDTPAKEEEAEEIAEAQ
jgi:hypothetical protein